VIDRDRLLARVIAELKQPIEVDPAARQRVLDATIGASPRGLLGVLAAGSRWRPAWAALAAAASVAAVAFAALIGLRESTGEPGLGPAANWTTPVRFVLTAQAARGVALVGDFNDWDRDATPLQPSGGGDEWSVTVRLAPGRYTYAFVVDGTHWVPDPEAPRAPDDGFGVPTSVILVPEGL
jgi:hypothetical protein